MKFYICYVIFEEVYESISNRVPIVGDGYRFAISVDDYNSLEDGLKAEISIDSDEV